MAGNGARGFPVRSAPTGAWSREQNRRSARCASSCSSRRRSSPRGCVARTSRRSSPSLASQGPRSSRKLLVDLAAQALRESRAFAGRGDGDLQVAAADHRTEEEIAVGNIVDAVARNVARHGFAINCRIDFGHIGSGDNDEVAIEIGGTKLALDPFELAFGGELRESRRGRRAQRREACTPVLSKLPIFSSATVPAPTSRRGGRRV